MRYHLTLRTLPTTSFRFCHSVIHDEMQLLEKWNFITNSRTMKISIYTLWWIKLLVKRQPSDWEYGFSVDQECEFVHSELQLIILYFLNKIQLEIATIFFFCFSFGYTSYYLSGKIESTLVKGPGLRKPLGSTIHLLCDPNQFT